MHAIKQDLRIYLRQVWVEYLLFSTYLPPSPKYLLVSTVGTYI